MRAAGRANKERRSPCLRAGLRRHLQTIVLPSHHPRLGGTCHIFHPSNSPVPPTTMTHSVPLSTSSRTLGGRYSPNFRDLAGASRAPQSLLRSLSPQQAALLSTFRYPWGKKPVQAVKQLAYLRYALDRNQEGNTRYLRKLLEIPYQGRKSNSTNKETSPPDPYLLQVEPGDRIR